MKKELDEALCKDFPRLFGDRFADMRETAMCWGFECGDGWEPLIRELAVFIEYINKNLLTSKNYIISSQVKEKYGTLSFYVSSVPSKYADVVFDAIDKAERKSAKICEVCGKRGKLRGKGWYYTACLKHAKGQDKK